MSDQKAMKKRLKALMALSENQICVDCPEKKPTWASIIAPPPGSPPGTEKAGAFVCLECSGSHRRLGVHITFVRSVNLDSWKDWEVRAMENGGNAKVNSIFEASLDREKLSNHASGPTRERYIRDKYERRKYYNPAGFAMPGNSGSAGGNGQAPRAAGAVPSSRPGAPSEIARQRVAQRQARMKTAQSQAEAPRPSKPQAAQAPASAPVVMDLLDFGTSPAPAPAAFPTPGFTSDPFAAQPTGSQPVTSMTDPAPAPVAATPSIPPTLAPPPQTAQQQPAKQPGSEFLTPAPAAQPQAASNDSIMALFGNAAQSNAGFGMQPGMMNNNMGMMGGMIPQQQQQQGMMGGMTNPGIQQQNMNGGGMLGNGSQMMAGGQIMNPQMMMMNQQQQQQMMMMMQQQQMQMQMQKASNNMNQLNMSNSFPQQGNQSMAGGMMNSFGNSASKNAMNAMGQSMQQMGIGGAQNQQGSDDGGFGAPMGGNAPLKDDPFSSLGGMNAFR
ncbi:MAG: hypothetical protein SGBAC_002487 [Bacillariaceae sp.]